MAPFLDHGVEELCRQEGWEQPIFEDDVKANDSPGHDAAEADAMEDVAVNDDDSDASEAEPLVTQSKKTRPNIFRCIMLSIIDSIRSTGRYLFDFFDSDNLNPWVRQPDIEMTLETDVTEEVIAKDQIAKELVPLEEEAPVKELIPAEAFPEGLIQRIYAIGNVSEWHDMSLEERLERAQKFYTSVGMHKQAAETDTLMTEVDTGDAPVGPLSNKESADFASMLSSMLQYHKADRASLDQVIKQPWFTTSTTDPWELQGEESPWIVNYHPGTNYVTAEEREDALMPEEDAAEAEEDMPAPEA